MSMPAVENELGHGRKLGAKTAVNCPLLSEAGASCEERWERNNFSRHGNRAPRSALWVAPRSVLCIPNTQLWHF